MVQISTNLSPMWLILIEMIISIAGNIGSGKSTLIKNLSLTLKNNVYEEPVSEWSLLPLFYKNMERWSFSLQVQILLSILDFSSKKLNIIERSPWESLRIFSRYAMDKKLFDPLEYSLLEELHSKLAWTPDIIIYLQCNPEICCQRISNRGRECENDIDSEYIKNLHEYYENEICKLKDKIMIKYINAEDSQDVILEKVNSILANVFLNDKYKTNAYKPNYVNSTFATYLVNYFFHFFRMVFRLLFRKGNENGEISSYWSYRKQFKKI